MAVLRKQRQPEVSFIQIMQIRVQNKRKSVRKGRYIGDVSLSDKVKLLHGVCISYNKATTIRLLPVANNFYKT